ncbi:MAG TPA: glycoside hydrolase [Candidatus Bathyarchaeia archaeon]
MVSQSGIGATMTISGKYDRIGTTATVGTYCVQNNVWNAGTPQTLEVNYRTGAFTVEVAGHDMPTNGSPASFASIFRGNHWGATTSASGMPKQVSNITRISTSWIFRTVTSGAWNCVYDIWFHKTSDYKTGPYNGAELMIWLNYKGTIQPAGSKVATVCLAGATWEVWYADWASFDYIAYRRTSTTTWACFDMNTFFKDSLSRGYIDGSWYLIAVEAGFELWQNGAGLASRSFSVTVC